MRKIAIALLALTAGCAKHTITYNLTDANKWKGTAVDKVVRVKAFADTTDSTNAGENAVVKNIPYRTNFKAGYGNNSVAEGVTNMLVKHLKHSGLFKDVVTGDGPADFELSGEISKYLALSTTNKTAEGNAAVAQGVGGHFLGGFAGAALGAAVKANATVETKTDVELKNVALKEVATGKVVWTETITQHTEHPEPLEKSEPDKVFTLVDPTLQVAVDMLVQKLGTTLTAAPAQ